MVSKICVKSGDAVEENQVLAVIEAMKMETSVVARMAGTVEQVLIKEGGSVGRLGRAAHHHKEVAQGPV